jgi:hypothetical protein
VTIIRVLPRAHRVPNLSGIDGPNQIDYLKSFFVARRSLTLRTQPNRERNKQKRHTTYDL